MPNPPGSPTDPARGSQLSSTGRRLMADSPGQGSATPPRRETNPMASWANVGPPLRPPGASAKRTQWDFGGPGQRFLFVYLLLGLLTVAPSPTLAETPTADEFFEKEVRPLLAERCQSCHSDAKHKGGLKLTSRASLLTGGDTGSAVVPGKPDESLLIAAIRYRDDPKMPPKGKLADREIETLTRWVALGLPWPEASAAGPIETASRGQPYRITDAQRQFWSFQPVRDPAPPAVQDASWPRSDLDRFILAALEAKGLRPAEPADKRTLIRRATFDLSGLPPTPAEVDAFLADTAPDAFARVVDRLLASPTYGERWGRHWLDLVRYADSRDARGVGGDADIGEAWRYRDWVVAAFNRDLPYDRFVRDQVAGDLLPAKPPGSFNADGLVATGLLAIGEWGPGDADKEKMMTDIVDDQIDVVGRAFLGLTLACARCHDHKFDPIPQADYYSLAGIFFSTRILPDPGPKTNGSPLLRTPIVPDDQVQKLARRRIDHPFAIVDLDWVVRAATDARLDAIARASLSETGRYLLAAWDARRERSAGTLANFASARGLREPILRRWIHDLGFDDDGRPLDPDVTDIPGHPGVRLWKKEGAPCPNALLNSSDREDALSTFRLPAHSVAIHPGPQSAVAVSWTSPFSGAVALSGRLADADPSGGDGVTWSCSLRHAGFWEPLSAGALTNGGAQDLAEGPGADRLARVPVEPGDVIRLVVGPKAEYACDTTVISLAIAPTDGPVTWDLASNLVTGPPDLGAIWRFAEVDADDRPRPTDPALETFGLVARDVAAGRRFPAAHETAARAVQETVDREPDGALARILTSPTGPFRLDPADMPASAREALKSLQDELNDLKANPPPPTPVTLAAQEGGVPNSAHAGIHDARIHIRGNYQRLGEVVPRRFPRILAGDDQPPIGPGSGRLELARWLTRPDHPLTPRVMVNRLWQHHFGDGIVRTSSNFGKLGEPPSNPDLLDHLARRFVSSGWSIKAMHRVILLSATYQQSGRPTADGLRLDPENRLFGRMNRRRLESEAIRDSLLAAAGRLAAAMGGPSSRDFADPRRTLYLMTIRSDRSSFGPLFDAADSTAIVEKRTVSTVAPQSLFLLNNPFALEQARALARRLAAEGPPDDDGRIRLAYALLYGRPPEPEDLSIGRSILARLRASGPADRAWAAYCQVLLCANELVYVD